MTIFQIVVRKTAKFWVKKVLGSLRPCVGRISRKTPFSIISVVIIFLYLPELCSLFFVSWFISFKVIERFVAFFGFADNFTLQVINFVLQFLHFKL